MQANSNRIPVNRKLLTRFFSKIKIDPAVAFKGVPCWLWTAYITPDGYGKIQMQGSCRPAHRMAFGMFVHEIPSGNDADHLCRVRNCVNPVHVQDIPSVAHRVLGHARRTHCKQGHPFSPENMFRDTRGNRVCRTCRKRIVDAYNHKRPSRSKTASARRTRDARGSTGPTDTGCPADSACARSSRRTRDSTCSCKSRRTGVAREPRGSRPPA